MPKPTKPALAHIGIAVGDADLAAALYRDVLGLEVRPLPDADGAKILSVQAGRTELELLEPTTPDGPIAKFLDKRGPGIHHICIRVPNVQAALAQCRAAGYRLVDERPRTGAHGSPIAFLHPKSTQGVLIELTE